MDWSGHSCGIKLARLKGVQDFYFEWVEHVCYVFQLYCCWLTLQSRRVYADSLCLCLCIILFWVSLTMSVFIHFYLEFSKYGWALFVPCCLSKGNIALRCVAWQGAVPVFFALRRSHRKEANTHRLLWTTFSSFALHANRTQGLRMIGPKG